MQFHTLTKEELNDPSFIMREFVEDVSLAAIRNLIVTMRDICLTTENVFCGDAQSREDLLYVTQKMTRFFEASYAHFKANMTSLNKPITSDFAEQSPCTDVRLLRVSERSFFKRSKGGPIVLPCITLFGKWLSGAGFHPGDEIAIAGTFQTLLITMNREWDKDQGDFKQRA